MTSAVDWLISKFGTNFARNSKFHIRITILSTSGQCDASITHFEEHRFAYFCFLDSSSILDLFCAYAVP